MLHSNKNPLDILQVGKNSCLEQGSELTFAELVHSHTISVSDGSDLRLRKWVSAFGKLSAWELETEQIDIASKAMIDHGYAPSTVNRDVGTIGSLYKWAKTKRLTPKKFRSPSIGALKYAEKIRRVHVENEKIEALRARSLAVSDRRFGCYVALLLDTGARKSELLHRKWSEVNLDSQEILAPTTKNGNPRVLFFSDKTAALLKRVFPKRDPNHLIFEGRVPGQPISFRRVWGVITREVDLKDLHMHDARHLAASSLLRAGVTLGVAAQVLGHDPSVLARRYGHLETGALKNAQETSWKKN